MSQISFLVLVMMMAMMLVMMLMIMLPSCRRADNTSSRSREQLAKQWKITLDKVVIFQRKILPSS